MAQQQFGYTPVSSGINTTPLMTQSQPGVYFNNKSKAASDIESIMNAALQVGKTYGTYKQEQNKITENETNLQLLNIKLEHQEKLNSLNDNDVEGYKQITNSYRTKADTILGQSELSDESRIALTTSITETEGLFNNHVTKAVKIIENKQATEGVTAAIANLHNAPVDDNTRVVFNGLKETLRATGKSDMEIEDFLASQYLSTKLSTIDKDNTSIAEMNSLLKNSDEFIKNNISSNMINKELHTKFKNNIVNIKEGLQKEEIFKLNQYAENDATSFKTFKDMVTSSKSSGALDDITAANLLQKKNDKIEATYIRTQAKKDIAENKVKHEAYQNLQAIMTNELLDDSVKYQAVQDAVDKKIISPDVASNFASDVVVKNMQEEKLIDIERNKAILLEKKQLLEDEKAKMSVSLKDSTIKPEVFEQLMLQTTLGEGKVLSASDQKVIDDYKVQYKLENDVFTTKTLYETFDTDWNNKPGKEGYKKAVNTLVSNEYNSQQFNPKAIIELNKRHKVNGDIEQVVAKETNNASTAITAVAKFNALDTYDSNGAKDFYGDKTYAYLKGLSNITTIDKDKNTIVPADGLAKMKDIKANPDKYPVDMQEFNSEVKDNLKLFEEKETYKTYIRYGMDADEAMDLIKNKTTKYTPVEGVNLRGYNKPVSPNDNRYMELNVFDIQKSNKNMVGFAYNPQDNTFYYSSKEDTYYSKIEKLDSKGNKVPISTLEDLNSVFEDRRKNKAINSLGGKVLQTIDNNIDLVNKPTPEQVKAFTNTMKQ